MISGAGLCWQHVGGVGSTTTTTSGSQYGRRCSRTSRRLCIDRDKDAHGLKELKT